MTSYQRLKDGRITTADDPERGIFYTTCGFWTDDWDKVSTTVVASIPCCPKCGLVGFQTTADEWFTGAKKYEDDNHPNYVEFIIESKEICSGPSFNYERAYQDWFTRLEA
jgi:hypothetical protein